MPDTLTLEQMMELAHANIVKSFATQGIQKTGAAIISDNNPRKDGILNALGNFEKMMNDIEDVPDEPNNN